MEPSSVDEPQLAFHPSIKRFHEVFNAQSRLLFITAARGTERHLFAQSWFADHPGETLDLSAPNFDLQRELSQVEERMDADPAARFAVLIGPTESAWLLSSRFDCVVARQCDLLMTYDELQETLGSTAEDTTKIFEQTGGWSSASLSMRNNPEDTTNAYHIIRTGLARWLAVHPQAEAIRQAGFLPIMDEPCVEEFYNQLGNLSFGFAELQDLGFVQAGPSRGWIMPHLVRRALVEQQRDIDPVVAQELELLGLRTVANTHSVQRAVDNAVQRRNWKALDHVLVERWIDLFITNPRGLRKYLSQVPEFVMNRTSYMWVAVRIVAAIGTDRMVLPFPSIVPNYESDRAAQRMRELTTSLYRRPSPRALTAGLLEISYLRLAGLYSESADAAERLRSVAQAVSSVRRVNPKLLSAVELHCGISLELEGRDVQAKWAYTAAYQAAQVGNTAFQIADATGRLALLCAKQKDPTAADHWLALHDEVIAEVAWGREMVGRGATLARGCLALQDLDPVELDRVMGNLPKDPDSDEFWASHVLFLAFQAALSGQVQEHGLLLRRLADERVYALSDLSAEHLEQARQVLALTGHWEESEPAEDYHAAEFRALAALRAGRFDRALSLLEAAKTKPLSQRYAGLHLYLEMATRHQHGPSDQQIEELKRLYATQNRLVDLAMLSTIPGWEAVPELMELDSESMDRIRLLQQAFPAPKTLPKLTERENELLALLREGLTRKQIAATTYRSENTIKTQLRGLYRKLDVADGVDALDRARELGL